MQTLCEGNMKNLTKLAVALVLGCGLGILAGKLLPQAESSVSEDVVVYDVPINHGTPAAFHVDNPLYGFSISKYSACLMLLAEGKTNRVKHFLDASLDQQIYEAAIRRPLLSVAKREELDASIAFAVKYRIDHPACNRWTTEAFSEAYLSGNKSPKEEEQRRREFALLTNMYTTVDALLDEVRNSRKTHNKALDATSQ